MSAFTRGSEPMGNIGGYEISKHHTSVDGFYCIGAIGTTCCGA